MDHAAAGWAGDRETFWVDQGTLWILTRATKGWRVLLLGAQFWWLAFVGGCLSINRGNRLERATCCYNYLLIRVRAGGGGLKVDQVVNCQLLLLVLFDDDDFTDWSISDWCALCTMDNGISLLWTFKRISFTTSTMIYGLGLRVEQWFNAAVARVFIASPFYWN